MKTFLIKFTEVPVPPSKSDPLGNPWPVEVQSVAAVKADDAVVVSADVVKK